MLRRVLIAASATSLLLGTAMALFWVRSYRSWDEIRRNTLDANSLRYTSPWIAVQSGRIIVCQCREDLDRESFALKAAELRDGPPSIKPGLRHRHGPSAPYIPKTQWDRFGVAVTRIHDANQPYMGWKWYWSPKERELRRTPEYGGRYSLTAISLDFSFGYLVVLCLIAGYPAMKSLGRVIRCRRHPGLCRHCGYDLRASKGRCPECGTPIPAGLRPHRFQIETPAPDAT